MATLNIIDLIEKNPITKLSASYNNKLINKIKENFTETQQQLFVASFYSYLKYDKNTDFIIDLDDVWKWLGFSQKANVKKIIDRTFIIDIDYKISLIQSAEQENSHGGNNKQKIMMNIKTFKLLCIKAGTQKSNEIHEYFIKLEELLYKLVEEENDELKIQLIKIEDKSKQDIKQLEDKNKKEIIQTKIREHERVLLQKFGESGPLIYIIKVKSYENGQYVIKLGESRKGIKARYAEHKNKYEEVLLLDCFAAARSKDFESFLHNHDSIRLNKVKDLEGHTNENELFLIGKNLIYQTIINIIVNNIKYFNDTDNEIQKLNLEVERLTLLSNSKTNNDNTNELIKELINSNKILSNKIDNLEKSHKELATKINSTQTRSTTGFVQPLVTLGPRLQKINPETLQLVQVYESVSECMKEYNNAIKRPSINKAINENTVYHGYRWLLVDRDLDQNIIAHIEPTRITRPQSLGYIAQLNAAQTEIINVYLDRKSAARFNGYASTSALDTPVKKSTIANGFYYKLYAECGKNLKDDFITKNDSNEPILYKDGIGQYDTDNNLTSTFICKYDCIKSLKMSDKTLAKALTNKSMYNNFYYRYLESRLKIF